jgi:hypothetical protein
VITSKKNSGGKWARARGIGRLRVDLVRESADEAARVFTAYSQLLAGQLAPREVVRASAFALRVNRPARSPFLLQQPSTCEAQMNPL